MSDTSWEQTKELVLAALERSPSDRERFLREECRDPALLEGLASILTLPADPSLTIAQYSAEIATGSRIGPYVVLHRLGRGGMGEVFLAQDTRLDRQVALKCLLPSAAAGPDLRERVIGEARAAARISHPHVATVHDVLEHEGRAFIVMEYVEGESLAVVLRRGALSIERVIAIGRQLAAALASAHSGGIVHRDLKPANIQVMPNGSVKVLDFGVAIARATAATATTRADAGVPAPSRALQAGTPPYMSPEQLLGQTADERSDLFSLAVILFEMATGRRPVPSTEPLDLLMASLQTLPRADSTSARVPAALADVIARGLAADPRDRYQTAVEMESALEAVYGNLFRTGTAPIVTVPVRGRARVAGWVVAGVAAVPVVIWILGRISSAAYNITLERSGTFAREPQLAYIVWGTRSLAAPLVQIALVIVALSAVRFILRLAILVPSLDRQWQRVRTAGRAVAERLSLEDPIVLAQALTTMGLIALAITSWRFYELIRAWGGSVSIAEPSQLWPLWPDSNGPVLYRATLTLLFAGFCTGLLRVLQLRSRNRTRGGGGALTALVAIIVLLLLLNEAPYRILFKNDAPRVVFESMRCYVTGEDHERLLLYCPDSAAPRTRVVTRSDPTLRWTGIVESIFTPSRDVR